MNEPVGRQGFPMPVILAVIIVAVVAIIAVLAAIQFFGNDRAFFNGQAFIDCGAHNNAAVIFRTAPAGQAVGERMRVAANGNVGIGTPNPQQDQHISGPDSRLLVQATDGSSYAVTEYQANSHR